jgi:hypothetical protein
MSSTSTIEVFIVLLFLPSPLVCNSLPQKRTNVRRGAARDDLCNMYKAGAQSLCILTIDKLMFLVYNMYVR